MTGTINTGGFKPAWWLPGPHSQTLWAYIFRRRSRLSLKTERLELPDGDFVDLCWTDHHTGPIVAVFHGLEGNISSPYARAIMSEVHRRGWRGVFMHFRGCSGEPNRLDGSYHSGHTEDIRFLVEMLRNRFPDTPICTIGYSLGGNALLKYLGEAGSRTPVTACVAVSVPYILHDSAARLSNGLSRLYQHRLLRSLRNKVRIKFRDKPPPFPLNRLKELNTFHKFDDLITSPLHGFNGADDYYSRSSSRQYLSGIRVPTLLIHSKDDPFMTPVAIPGKEELSDSVILELTDRGGHVGFVGGIVPWKAEYWLEKKIVEFIESNLS